MVLSPDDARTDVILVAATAVLGLTLRNFVSGLPLYPGRGVVALLLDLAWIVALTALVPVLLARHRGDGATAFGIHAGPRPGGLLLAVPAALLGLTTQALTGAAPSAVLLGRVAGAGAVPGNAVDLVVGAAAVGAFLLGSLVLVGFLAVRSRDGFPRSPHVPLTELVRTLGLGAVGVAIVAGLLRALGPGSLGLVGLNVLGLAAILLVVDRLVPAGVRVVRTTVVAPVVIVTVAHVFATGGLFRGDLLAALYLSALAAGTTVAVAALTQTRTGSATAVPLLLAVHWWPTCLSPLTFASGVC